MIVSFKTHCANEESFGKCLVVPDVHSHSAALCWGGWSPVDSFMSLLGGNGLCSEQTPHISAALIDR